MEDPPQRAIPGNGHDPLAATAMIQEIVVAIQSLPPGALPLGQRFASYASAASAIRL
jgi:hypothetical protein